MHAKPFDFVHMLLAAERQRGCSPASRVNRRGLSASIRRRSRNLLQPSAAELERRLRVAKMVCMEPHRQRRGAQSALRTLQDPGLVQMVLALAEGCV